MSANRQLADMVASLPECSTLEEAFSRLYRAFQDKLRREAAGGGSTGAPQPGAARPSFPVIDTGAWSDSLSLRREDFYGDDGR